jgi:hypothetical protein
MMIGARPKKAKCEGSYLNSINKALKTAILHTIVSNDVGYTKNQQRRRKELLSRTILDLHFAWADGAIGGHFPAIF